MNLPSLIALIVALFSADLRAESKAPQRKVYRDTQEVDFDGVDIDGIVRKPDGAYLSPKRGVDFIPLYQVKKQIDENIKESVDYLR